jgi:triphosphoribosyl-dephospho-CoA synthase
VAGEPTVTLLESMRLAAGRGPGGPPVRERVTRGLRPGPPRPCARRCGGAGPLETAIIGSALALLARHPDTLIARKRGEAEAREASRRAGEVLAPRLADTPAGTPSWSISTPGSAPTAIPRNPRRDGRLVTAALFAALRDGTIPLPIAAGPSGWPGAAEGPRPPS